MTDVLLPLGPARSPFNMIFVVWDGLIPEFEISTAELFIRHSLRAQNEQKISAGSCREPEQAGCETRF